MFVECINNNNYENRITIGNIYKVVSENNNMIKIFDDKEDLISFDKSLFINTDDKPVNKINDTNIMVIVSAVIGVLAGIILGILL